MTKSISNKLAVSSARDTLLENQIFVDVLEDYEYNVLPKKRQRFQENLTNKKELFFAPLVECFKKNAKGKSFG